MNYFIKFIIAFIFISTNISYMFASTNTPSDTKMTILTLEQTIKAAQEYDPWLIGNQHSQNAVESMSIAAGTLPDPKVSIGLANIAADTFDFNQEGMTQIKVGISQMFPRGDTLKLRKKQLQLMGSQYPFQRENRRAKVTVKTAKLWLDAYLAQESIALIEKDRTLFEQLADVAEASYSAALGKTRQHDIIRAQLELTRLDDRLTQLKQKQEMSVHKLSQWINNFLGENSSDNKPYTPMNSSSLYMARDLPDINMLQKNLFTNETDVDPQKLYEYFSKHPAVNALDQKIKASKSGINLAKQKYQPQWGVSAGYGYRDNAPTGADRADLFSIGISFDIPLFTTNRQDKEVQAAISKSAAVRSEKLLLIRQLIAAFETNRSQLHRINERHELYQQRLLPQMHSQAEASLTAYTNDDGDFSEVVRSRIAELNAAIDALGISVERQKYIIQLNYFFMNNADEIILTNLPIIQGLGVHK